MQAPKAINLTELVHQRAGSGTWKEYDMGNHVKLVSKEIVNSKIRCHRFNSVMKEIYHKLGVISIISQVEIEELI
jgi:hypothetical protein